MADRDLSKPGAPALPLARIASAVAKARNSGTVITSTAGGNLAAITKAVAAVRPNAGTSNWGLVVDLTASRGESRNRLIGDSNLQNALLDRLFKLVGSLATTYFRGNQGPRVEVFSKSEHDAAAIKRFLSADCLGGGTEIASAMREIMQHKRDGKMNVLLILDTADGDNYPTIMGAIGDGARLFIVHDIHGDASAGNYKKLFADLCQATGGQYIPCEGALKTLEEILGQAEGAVHSREPITPGKLGALALELANAGRPNVPRIAPPRSLLLDPTKKA